ncbi:translation initiation factor eIF 4e-like domain-containing protein [Mycena rebaudengoi]|nr:translation initiation factor eIF 4e-like domain-containing protein [Mycena rebaudengoi]
MEVRDPIAPVEQPRPCRPLSSQSPQPSRLPSLNQLAARINSNNAPNGAAAAPAASSTSAPRPRLAAFTLRTTSNTSLSTVASTNDSIAVNAPSTRSTSPSALSSSPRSGTPSNDPVVGGDPNLTSEKLEKLNLETAAPVPDKKNVKVGYKNIPSLDAITARLAKTRALSIDGTAKPPDAEMIEDPKTPGFPMKAPEHPLEYPWTIYHDSKTKVPFTPASAMTNTQQQAASPSATPSSETFGHPPESTDYEAGLTVVGEFSTVEEFCRYFNWLKPPSHLERNSNYHLFKSGIKPMWEDEANANGGKWVLTMKNNPALLDRCWNWLAMALVGEELEEGHDLICGAVVSLRSKVDRIQVWTRSKDDVEKLNGIGKKLVKLLDVSEADGIGLEFQYNSDDRPLANKFLSIQAMPITSYRPTFPQGGLAPGGRMGSHGRTESIGAGSTPYTPIEGQNGPASAGPASGAFGSFGIGIGGAAAWRGAKRP